MNSAYTASSTITATAQNVFSVLADPSLHHRFDASGMVGRPASTDSLTRPGQAFTMNMTYRDGDLVENYQSDNHVIIFDPPRSIGWATAAHGGEPLGWVWRYELQPASHGTTVTVTYDWTGTSLENIRRFGVPLVDPDGLLASLQLLADVFDG